jgi:hypothetical protein
LWRGFRGIGREAQAHGLSGTPQVLARLDLPFVQPDFCCQLGGTDIHQIAAGSFANLPRFRVLGNPAPLARAVDGDGTSRRHAER